MNGGTGYNGDPSWTIAFSPYYQNIFDFNLADTYLRYTRNNGLVSGIISVTTRVAIDGSQYGSNVGSVGSKYQALETTPQFGFTSYFDRNLGEIVSLPCIFSAANYNAGEIMFYSLYGLDIVIPIGTLMLVSISFITVANLNP